ncbi:hypothetical protein PPTG_24879 [Phytophthora nicotianae INRA-310]|uniref:Uncharacterized protein n=1 Tax=Phytophthora nicotianae (strain INRA-310) TaxID=761204 RepID=W2PBP6_PHYN3|nr:hypothetical protein PPTG_24879 [Phytophthora nicotianae INRA-310]ETM97653.1 hypothetical protein PPTG_24879 [Phytophthora nicotianae INRA-310]
MKMGTRMLAKTQIRTLLLLEFRTSRSSSMCRLRLSGELYAFPRRCHVIPLLLANFRIPSDPINLPLYL